MAIVFPASPSVNETFTAGSITYKWDGDKWIGLGVTPADRLVEGSNSLEIDANNDLKWIGDQLIVGDFAPIDDRNGGGIHIRHSSGISFKSNSLQSVSRNWRIRGDDWGWGNLDFGVGDSVSDWSDSAADNVLSLTSSRYVGVRKYNPKSVIDVGLTGTANIATTTISSVTNFAPESSFGFSGLANNNDGVYFGMGSGGGNGIPAGMGFMREASGWRTALAFYTNNITSGPDSTNALQEKVRIDSDGRLIVGNTTNTITEAKIEAYADNAGNNDILCLYNKNAATGNTANILFAPSNTVAGARIICEAMEDFTTSANRTADLSFVTRVDGSLNEALRLTGDRKLRAATAYASGTDISGISNAKAYFDFNPTLNTWGSTGNKDTYFEPALVVRTPVRDSINNPAIVIADTGGQASGRNSLVFFNSEYNGNAGFIKARLYTQVGSSYSSTAFFIDVADSSQTIQNRFIIDVNGTFSGSSANNISDARLKENIQTIENPIEKIKGLTGRTFTWTDASTRNDGKVHYGFIAQEVDTVVSDLVNHDSGLTWFDADDNIVGEFDENVANSSKTVHEQGVIPILVEALKEALAEIETLKGRLDAAGL